MKQCDLVGEALLLQGAVALQCPLEYQDVSRFALDSLRRDITVSREYVPPEVWADI